MARNVEVKAEVADLVAVEQKARDLSGSEATVLEQDDTFFNCDNGRLKLRDYGDGTGELIFYRRPDSQGPSTSHYSLAATQDPSALRTTLTEAYGTAGRVVKTRRVYLIGRTRVHLDRVRDLGTFMELEVVLNDGEDADEGVVEANALMTELGVDPDKLIGEAYVDMLLSRQ